MRGNCPVLSSRQAVIVLIEKKDKDKCFLKNWRPLSLINVDAKIASKAIALRIKKVIVNLVHCDQTAYVCKRNIGESVRLINDILEYTDENDIEAILFSADFEKAFDSIEHSFIISTLRFYLSPHFPPTFEVMLTRFGSLISPYVPLGHRYQSGSALWLQLCNIWAS